MKILLPTDDDAGMEGQLSDRFTKASSFTIYDTLTKNMTILPNMSNGYLGIRKNPTQIIQEEGISALICRHIGQQSIEMLLLMGVMVYKTRSTIVRLALEDFEKGKLDVAKVEDTHTKAIRKK